MTFVIVLPLLLKRFSSAELAVWYLFATLSSLQMLAELGFGSTFVRVIAYAMGGAEDLDSAMAGKRGTRAGLNADLLGAIVGTMRVVYRRLTILLAVVLGIGGTWALVHPINQITDARSAWIAWTLVYAATLLSFPGNGFSVWLQGTNQIAILRRWETITALASIGTSFVLLKLNFGLLPLVIGTQLWVIASVLRNIWLAFHSLDGLLKRIFQSDYSPEVFKAVWPSAWRSGVGVAMSQGVTQLSGLIYAQTGGSQSVAGYLLAIRLQVTLAAIANAPFASKLPILARWWAEEARDKIQAAAKRTMAMTLWGFVVPLGVLGLSGSTILRWIGSQTDFPDLTVWWLLGAATLVERFGAMHMQLYSLSNRIVWHVANGGAGLIAIGVAFLGFQHLGIAAVPLGFLVGNILFYMPYASWLSHKQFSFGVTKFDLPSAGPPVVAFLVFVMCGYLIK